MKDGIHGKWNTEHMEQVSQICKDFKPKQTNADRIRAMSDEELKDLFSGIDHFWDIDTPTVVIEGKKMEDNPTDILEWLQSEVE